MAAKIKIPTHWEIDEKIVAKIFRNAEKLPISNLSEISSLILRLNPPNFWHRHMEIFLSKLYSLLPEYFRWKYSSFVKKIQNKTDKQNLSALSDLSDSLIDPLIYSISNSIVKQSNPVADTLLLTHDVDYSVGYKSILKIAETDHSLGYKSAFYFLTNAGYTLDKSVIKELNDMGHEIGLHGHTYDLRLAYRSTKTIFRTLDKAKKILEDLLGQPIYGFRNHSLLLTSSLLEAVSKMDFLYQSGLYEHKASSLKRWFCWPFRYHNTYLWEIPVSFPQDAEVFRKYHMDDISSIKIFISTMKKIMHLGGVGCFNFHPSIILQNNLFYTNLLQEFKELSIKNCLPVTLIKHLKTIIAE